MNRIPLLGLTLLSFAAAAASMAAPPNLSVDQIVEKNIAARGGLARWQGVKTLTLEGQMDAGGKPSHRLPFVLKMKRPHKSRLEIVFKDQTSVQVYDGNQGWKVRPFLNRNDVDAYTPAEAKLAAAAEELDGPLVDSTAKGTKITLAGTDTVDGHPAYKLLLTMRDGEKRRLWIDAGTFLETKMDGAPRKLDGKMHNVAIYFHDFRTEQGVTTPRMEETVVEGVKEPYKRIISRVLLNEPMDDALFRKPQPSAGAAAAAAAPVAAPSAKAH